MEMELGPLGNNKMRIKLGPVGDYSVGERWEETGRGPISHIFVTYNTDIVRSIQFGYVENGALVLSKKHGATKFNSEADSIRIVRLNHESEFITGISGEKCFPHVSALTFHTNERKHVAFQAEFNSKKDRRPQTTEFHSGIHDRCEFGGFFGSCQSWDLYSIGLYIRPVLPGVDTIKQEIV